MVSVGLAGVAGRDTGNFGNKAIEYVPVVTRPVLWQQNVNFREMTGVLFPAAATQYAREACVASTTCAPAGMAMRTPFARAAAHPIRIWR